jgi:DNA helicase HerA-like ATPase
MNSDNFKIIGVSRDIVTIEILDTTKFDDHFSIGSYVKIPYKHQSDSFIIGVIKNYKIKTLDSNDPEAPLANNHFVIEVELVGSYKKNDSERYIFERGAHGIPVPPNNGIELLSSDDLGNIYTSKLGGDKKFCFSKLSQNEDVDVPLDGNKFFNKHFAIVGSTGSGKSHTVASILQKAVREKQGEYSGLNNSHIVIFDIHGEYKKAFPDGKHIDFTNIKIPYWLFDSDELSDLFIESNEMNSHNQVSQFKYAVTENKVLHNTDVDKSRVYFDSPLKFNIHEVIQYIKNINNELIDKKNGRKPTDKNGVAIEDRLPGYFSKEFEFDKTNSNYVNGPYSGDFERFILRLEATVKNPRLGFLFDDSVQNLTLEDVLKQFLGYKTQDGTDNDANVTIVDLSGIPFEVLSITVSLISRVIFEFGYYYKKLLQDKTNCETPILLLYEEAHKYVPRSDLVRYRASKTAIERIAKEGRKYGITLGIVSQRPSEISETIFSQCNNFVAMRLTNPDDQNYVKKLLPDTVGDLTTYLPSLQSGEAIIIGESIVLPSVVKIDFPINEPASSDIRYLDLWREQWKSVSFEEITKEWLK